MFRRTRKDPLLQELWRKYRLNLLQEPREHAAVGDLYAVHDHVPLPPGRVGDLLTPAPRLPRVRGPERLAGLAGVMSDRVALGAGLRLLEGFLTALGAGFLVGRMRTHYNAASVRALRFRIEDASRLYVHSTSLGEALTGCSLKPDHPLVGGEYRYFMTVGVVRSSSITVTAEGSSERRAGLGGSVPLVADAHTSVEIEQRGEGELRYRGRRPLVIGVELMELDFGADAKLKFKPQTGPWRIRGVAERAFIGPDDGDSFLPL